MPEIRTKKTAPNPVQGIDVELKYTHAPLPLSLTVTPAVTTATAATFSTVFNDMSPTRTGTHTRLDGCDTRDSLMYTSTRSTAVATGSADDMRRETRSGALKSAAAAIASLSTVPDQLKHGLLELNDHLGPSKAAIAALSDSTSGHNYDPSLRPHAHSGDVGLADSSGKRLWPLVVAVGHTVSSSTHATVHLHWPEPRTNGAPISAYTVERRTVSALEFRMAPVSEQDQQEDSVGAMGKGVMGSNIAATAGGYDCDNGIDEDEPFFSLMERYLAYFPPASKIHKLLSTRQKSDWTAFECPGTLFADTIALPVDVDTEKLARTCDEIWTAFVAHCKELQLAKSRPAKNTTKPNKPGTKSSTKASVACTTSSAVTDITATYEEDDSTQVLPATFPPLDFPVLQVTAEYRIRAINSIGSGHIEAAEVVQVPLGTVAVKKSTIDGMTLAGALFTTEAMSSMAAKTQISSTDSITGSTAGLSTAATVGTTAADAVLSRHSLRPDDFNICLQQDLLKAELLELDQGFSTSRRSKPITEWLPTTQSLALSTGSVLPLRRRKNNTNKKLSSLDTGSSQSLSSSLGRDMRSSMGVGNGKGVGADMSATAVKMKKESEESMYQLLASSMPDPMVSRFRQWERVLSGSTDPLKNTATTSSSNNNNSVAGVKSGSIPSIAFAPTLSGPNDGSTAMPQAPLSPDETANSICTDASSYCPLPASDSQNQMFFAMNGFQKLLQGRVKFPPDDADVTLPPLSGARIMSTVEELMCRIPRTTGTSDVSSSYSSSSSPAQTVTVSASMSRSSALKSVVGASAAVTASRATTTSSTKNDSSFISSKSFGAAKGNKAIKGNKSMRGGAGGAGLLASDGEMGGRWGLLSEAEKAELETLFQVSLSGLSREIRRGGVEVQSAAAQQCIEGDVPSSADGGQSPRAAASMPVSSAASVSSGVSRESFGSSLRFPSHSIKFKKKSAEKKISNRDSSVEETTITIQAEVSPLKSPEKSLTTTATAEQPRSPIVAIAALKDDVAFRQPRLQSSVVQAEDESALPSTSLGDERALAEWLQRLAESSPFQDKLDLHGQNSNW